MNKNDRKTLLSLAIADRHIDFINGYERLTDSDQHDSDLMMAYGDALYELGRDAECIDVYLKFALDHPEKRGRDFALFGAAMAFKNIGLQVEALHILKLVKPDHGERNEEILHSEQKIDLQNRAINSLKKFDTKRVRDILKTVK